jgi:hypothetical protein
MMTRPLARRAFVSLALVSPLALPSVLAGCMEQPPPPQVFAPLSFAYLTKLRLDVASINVDNQWSPQPVPNGEHVEAQSPVQPAEALERMARDRLVPGGTNGRATFVIDDASLIRVADRYEANFAVHLDLRNDDGTRTGYAEARVSRTRTITDYSPQATPATLYELVKATMADMNVEFEYQVRRTLKDWLLSSTPTAPLPPPVQEQELTPPPKS